MRNIYIYILFKAALGFFLYFGSAFVTSTGCKGSDLVKHGSSRNYSKSSAICPGVKISNLGII